MPNRLLTKLAAGLAAVAMLVGTAFADELLGSIKTIDVEGKKIVVAEKDTDKDVDVTIKDDTTIETGKGKKVEIEKLKKGMGVTVTHEKGVASKIVVKKKVAPKQEAPTKPE